MIGNSVLKMKRMSAAKETDNKIRWDAEVEGTAFELYIPKWRVPSPPPSQIWVLISPKRCETDDLPNLSESDVQTDLNLQAEPIVATVIRYSEHTETVRYRPVGYQAQWEIGEPYIPFALIPDQAHRLRVIVLWGDVR